jgi:hypothetical protein
LDLIVEETNRYARQCLELLHVRDVPLPTPTPLQCPRCFQFGNGQAECTNKPICPKCPKKHPLNKCSAKESSSLHYKGTHPAWSRSCPILKQIEITDPTPVPPVKIANPPSELAEPADIETDPAVCEPPVGIIRGLIAFVTKTLFDLFPMQRAKIQVILEQTSKAVFKVVTKMSHSGHNIHFTYDPNFYIENTPTSRHFCSIR